MFDVLERIKALREERNWTVYRLSKLSGISQSTITTWYKKNYMPPIDKLEILCNTFEISLSDFFKNGADITSLTDNQQLMLKKWSCLTENQRKAVLNIIDLLLMED